MIFYLERTEESQQKKYERMMSIIASLSKLFSENTKPYINSRVPENLFCRYFDAENLSRSDVTADAKKGDIGIGIKTWIDSNYQKIAEFNKMKPELDRLAANSNKRLVNKVAELRNERIDFTLRTYGMCEMVYHCIKREEGKVRILECPLEKIDIDNIKNIVKKNNTINFEDGKHRYGFYMPKSTLYMHFEDMTEVKSMEVNINEDPYALLENLKVEWTEEDNCNANKSVIERAYLPLYSENGKRGKYVPDKNSLNIRFARGRKRNIYEVGIPVPKKFHDEHSEFFPQRGVAFDLILPNNRRIIAKICQDGGKALMSKPNSDLGHWIIDDVLKVDPNKKITYEMLSKFGIDSVCIDKLFDEEENKIYYKINFATINSYEFYIGNQIIEDDSWF